VDNRDQYFTGTYIHTLDDRGRLALPAKLRDRLGERVTVTIGIAPHSLAIYPESSWGQLRNRLLATPAVTEEDNNLRLSFFGEALDGTIDNQGRIAIPDYLREWAELTGEVAVVGTGDYITIWDKQAWINTRAALRAKRPSWPSPRSDSNAGS